MKYEFKPFEKVLVRDTDTDVWEANFYNQYIKDHEPYSYYVFSGSGYRQCIPYEGNEHLHGTTDKPEIKRWKPEFKETFFRVIFRFGVFSISEGKCYDRVFARVLYKNNNVFRTKEEAEAVAKAMTEAWKKTTGSSNE